MTEKEIHQLLEIAKKAALNAGAEILKIYNQPEFEKSLKSDSSPLTEADLASHHAIKRELLETDISMLSEEGRDIEFLERKNWDVFWLVDPLDGTKEFIKRNGEFTVNIALIAEGRPVFGVVYVPVDDLLYWGGKSIGSFRQSKSGAEKISVSKADSVVRVVASRSHMNEATEEFIDQFERTETVAKGSSLKFLVLAEGGADVYPRFGPTMEWDTAAAQAVLEGAGGKIRTYDGKPMQYNKENLLNPFFVAYGGLVSSKARDS